MRQAVLRDILHIDPNHQLYIDVPAEMGNEFKVMVIPIQSKAIDKLNDNEQFMLAAYSAVIENDPEEDAIWEKYILH